MIGLSALVTRLTGLGKDELVLWLEAGLRTVAPRDSAEGAELAFAPLLLSRDQPPMQQFHSAVDALPGAVQARLRWACGRLLDSLRVQDDRAYARSVWSLAIAFKPPSGVLAPARRYLASLSDDPRDIAARRPIIDAVVSAILSYPRSEEQDNFVAELRRQPFWDRSYTQDYVLYLVADNPRAWVPVIRCFNEELRSLSDGHSGFFRRLAKAIGPANLAREVGALNRREQLDWLQRSLHPFFRLRLVGAQVEAEVGLITAVLDGDEFGGANDDEVEVMLGAFEPEGVEDAKLARSRLGMALSGTRLDQYVRARLN